MRPESKVAMSPQNFVAPSGEKVRTCPQNCRAHALSVTLAAEGKRQMSSRARNPLIDLSNPPRAAVDSRARLLAPTASKIAPPHVNVADRDRDDIARLSLS